jgi:hypothetical protein
MVTGPWRMAAAQLVFHAITRGLSDRVVRTQKLTHIIDQRDTLHGAKTAILHLLRYIVARQPLHKSAVKVLHAFQ